MKKKKNGTEFRQRILRHNTKNTIHKRKKKCSLVRYLYKILHMISWPPFEAVWCTSTNKDLEKSYSREVLFSCLIHHFSNLFDHRKYYYGTTLRTDLGKCSFLFFSFLFFFWLCCMACGILVPQPGIEPMPPALEAQSFNHWTAREVPGNVNLGVGGRKKNKHMR